MKKAYSFRLEGEEEADAVRGFLRTRRGVAEKVEPEPVSLPPPSLDMPYEAYVGAMPKNWTLSERGAAKTVYDQFNRAQRIFRQGRDY